MISSPSKQDTVSFFKAAFWLPTVFLLLLSSCITVKKNQVGKPFVYAVNVRVEGTIPPGEKQDLTARLTNQLDDSLRPQIVSVAGVSRKLEAPPVFDTANVRRSLAYMVALLNASGYFAPVIKDTFRLDTAHLHVNILRFRFKPQPDQYRVTVDFRIWPGKQLRLDSIVYNLQTPELQALALQSRKQSLLKKGQPYSKQVFEAELDRLGDLFRNNGYYKFAPREDLLIVRDTVIAALIDPTLDPFQQASLLEELKRKREHPTINIEVTQRPVRDSSHITRYTVGHVTVYPDLPIVLEDSVTISTIDTSTAKGFTIISRTDRFKPTVLTNNVYLRPGRLFRQQNYNRTLTRFNQMGAWQQSSISMDPVDGSDTILNATLRLYPAKKMYINGDVEASRNTNDIVTANNLFGLGVNLGLVNRNAFRQSVLTSTNLRGGVQLGADFIQTTQVSMAHSISFPRALPPLKFRNRRDSVRTIINVNAAYTDRRGLFTVRSINGSYGYEWNRGNRSFLYRPLNIEYTQLDKLDSFQHYLDSIPSLNLAFKSGLVVSQQFVYSSLRKHGIHTDFLRISAEESGALLGLIKSIDEGDLWRFIKGDIEYRHHMDWRRTTLAMRAYAGAGWAYGREGKGFEQTLPFYKAFFAGGPNSMRGWQIRQLGLGSSPFYSLPKNSLVDRFGDVQLEGNIEYRFPLGTLFTIKLQSAVYVDAGNIWNRQLIDTAASAKGSDFKFDRFYNEIAVDAGTGLRLDFSEWLLIRFDWAYKLRDPQRLDHPNKWFYDMGLFKGQFQLGVGYPF